MQSKRVQFLINAKIKLEQLNFNCKHTLIVSMRLKKKKQLIL